MILLRSECVLPPACKPLPSDQHDKARYAATTRLCNADISGTVAVVRISEFVIPIKLLFSFRSLGSGNSSFASTHPGLEVSNTSCWAFLASSNNGPTSL